MKQISLFLLITLTTNVYAEYRVYQYVVKNKIQFDDAPKSHMVTSTLDPVSYVSYHGGEGLITVNLLRTWLCPGHTAHKDLCKSPYQSIKSVTENTTAGTKI